MIMCKCFIMRKQTSSACRHGKNKEALATLKELYEAVQPAMNKQLLLLSLTYLLFRDADVDPTT
jgi:hypothetical protein